MVDFLLKIETTGLDREKDNILQIMLLDLSGNIVYCKTFASSNNNNSIIQNNLNEDLLSKCQLFNKDLIETEINSIVKYSKVYSFNKDFDNSFIEINPIEWIDILSILPKRKRIPNLDCYKSISSPIYRKSLNIISLMREFSLINEEEELISLNF